MTTRRHVRSRGRRALLLLLSLVTLALGLVWSLPGAASSASGGEPAALPGLSRFAFGQYANVGAETFPRFAYVLVSPSAAEMIPEIKKASPNTKVLAFESASEVVDYSCPCPVSYQQAVAHDRAHPKDPWLLYSSAGRSLLMPHYPNNHLVNVGSASFQRQWAKGVANILGRDGFDGVYIDSVLGRISDTGAKPTLYKTDEAWEKAMRGWVKYVGPALKAKGFYVLANTYKSGPNDGSDDIAWWTSLAPYVSGLQAEYWEEAANSKTPFDTNPCCWTGHWLNWLKLADAAQANGTDFFAAGKGTADNTQLMSYLRGSYLLVWNGKGGGFSYTHQPFDNTDFWNPAWTTYIGKPKGARFQVGVGWRRNYSQGTVIVNPNPSKSQSVNLGGSFKTIDGKSVTSVVVQPRSAAILTS